MRNPNNNLHVVKTSMNPVSFTFTKCEALEHAGQLLENATAYLPVYLSPVEKWKIENIEGFIGFWNKTQFNRTF